MRNNNKYNDIIFVLVVKILRKILRSTAREVEQQAKRTTPICVRSR